MTYNNKWKIVHKHTMKYISKWERAKKNGLLCWSRVDGLIIIDFHAVHSLSLSLASIISLYGFYVMKVANFTNFQPIGWRSEFASRKYP